MGFMTGYKTIITALASILAGLATLLGGPIDQELLDLLEIDTNALVGGLTIIIGAVFGVLRLFTTTPVLKK